MFPVKRENEAFSRRAHAKRQRNVQTMGDTHSRTDLRRCLESVTGYMPVSLLIKTMAVKTLSEQAQAC